MFNFEYNPTSKITLWATFDLGHWLLGVVVIKRPNWTNVQLGLGPLAVGYDILG